MINLLNLSYIYEYWILNIESHFMNYCYINIYCFIITGHNRFGFALANGIVGVYSGCQRVWRSKVTCLSTTTVHYC